MQGCHLVPPDLPPLHLCARGCGLGLLLPTGSISFPPGPPLSTRCLGPRSASMFPGTTRPFLAHGLLPDLRTALGGDRASHNQALLRPCAIHRHFPGCHSAPGALTWPMSSRPTSDQAGVLRGTEIVLAHQARGIDTSSPSARRRCVSKTTENCVGVRLHARVFKATRKCIETLLKVARTHS
ncbi:hypothetical protein NDU88_006104 [Pleurodeles waltl]|uniref:Uncharacterized protein n=1 Tax=Pleurodeles waltl TaxID=8319 RepID=A0AAV7TCN3_PLEWA|nr:hypothetical protein NDU88_006104 [Pleurodeles waltl]